MITNHISVCNIKKYPGISCRFLQSETNLNIQNKYTFWIQLESKQMFLVIVPN